MCGGWFKIYTSISEIPVDLTFHQPHSRSKEDLFAASCSKIIKAIPFQGEKNSPLIYFRHREAITTRQDEAIEYCHPLLFHKLRTPSPPRFGSVFLPLPHPISNPSLIIFTSSGNRGYLTARRKMTSRDSSVWVTFYGHGHTHVQVIPSVCGY